MHVSFSFWTLIPKTKETKQRSVPHSNARFSECVAVRWAPSRCADRSWCVWMWMARHGVHTHRGRCGARARGTWRAEKTGSRTHEYEVTLSTCRSCLPEIRENGLESGNVLFLRPLALWEQGPHSWLKSRHKEKDTRVCARAHLRILSMSVESSSSIADWRLLVCHTTAGRA